MKAVMISIRPSTGTRSQCFGSDTAGRESDRGDDKGEGRWGRLIRF